MANVFGPSCAPLPVGDTTYNARLGEVILLDGRRVEIRIQPRLFAGDLFDMVASHFNLKEKEYFGLAFLDETGQYSWLNLERRVLEHEYAQKCRPKVAKLKGPEDEAISVSMTATSRSTSASLSTSIKVNQNLSQSNAIRNSFSGSNSRQPCHSRRVGDLKKKTKKVSQSQTSTNPFSKKGSLSNLSGSLRAKLHGANGMLSRLMSSTTSLPQTFQSEGILNSASTAGHVLDGGDHHPHHLGSQKGSSSSLGPLSSSTSSLKHINSNSSEMIRKDLISNSTNEDPLYDVIHEEGMIVANGGKHLLRSSNYLKQVTTDHSPPHLEAEDHLSYSNDMIRGCLENGLENDGEDEGEEEEEDTRLILYFLVKYFVDSISLLADTTTIELFFLQAKALLINETVQVLDLETNLTLLALILQSLYGDISSDSKARHRLHKQQLISSYLLQELTSSSACEERIIEEYRALVGTSRAQAIYRFMTLIEKQPTYGVHFYEVKDKSGVPYWLGLSGRGISQFDTEDRRLPRRQFPWKQLENLYFREKKFSIEVRDPKRIVHTLSSINLYENAIEDVDFDDLSTAICDPTTQVSVSRRTFGPCNVTVYVWFAASSTLTKCIWSMAISQHQFYIDRRLTKCQTACNRSAEEIISSLSASKNHSVLPSRKRYSITTSSSVSGLGLSRRFSSLGSIHSTTPSSEAPSLTNSLHSLSSSSTSSPSTLSLGGPSEHLWDSAASDSASLFGGRGVAATSITSSNRHSKRSISSSSAMSRSTSAVARSSRSLCYRRLRLLETQLNAKLEEVKKLDALEQQILERAARASLPPEQVPAMTSYTTSTSLFKNHHQSPPNSDQSLSSASSASSASVSSSSALENGAKGTTYRSALFSQPSIGSLTGTSSLKNFVVTGRSQGGSLAPSTSSVSSTDGPGQGGQVTTSNYSTQSKNQLDQPKLANSTSNLTINHQRSRSVGPGSKGSIDRKSLNHSQTTDASSSMTTTHSDHNLRNVQENKIADGKHLQKTSIKTMPKPYSSPSSIQQLPSFTSPYVNKFDTSVTIDEGTTNLYSVPNRRTSIALNSFDDTFLPATRNSGNNTIKNLDLMNNGGKLLYQFTTKAVTSSVNSVTLSTTSYRYEKTILPGGASTASSAQQPHQLPTTENVYATIGPGSRGSSASSSSASTTTADHRDHHHHHQLNLYSHQKPRYQNTHSSSQLQNSQHTSNYESSVDEIDSLPAAPAPPQLPVQLGPSESQKTKHNYHNNQQYSYSQSNQPANSSSYLMLPPQRPPMYHHHQNTPQHLSHLPAPPTIDEENLAQYKAAFLTRQNSFGSDQQQRSLGGYQNLANSQQNQHNQTMPYSAQIRAQSESLYANYVQTGSATSSTTGQKSFQSSVPMMSPSPSTQSNQQHLYQNAQSLLETLQHSHFSNYQNHPNQLNLQVPSSRSSPVSQSASPSGHIYQSVSPLPPPSTTQYTSNTSSQSLKKPAKTWFESDLDYATGYVLPLGETLPNNPNATYANEGVLSKVNSNFTSQSNEQKQAQVNQNQPKPHFPPLAERESSVDHDNHEEAPVTAVMAKVIDHQQPNYHHHQQHSYQTSSDQDKNDHQNRKTTFNDAPTTLYSTLFNHQLQHNFGPSSTSSSKSYPNSSMYLQTPFTTFASSVSPTPSNRSSVSSSASTFIQHGASSSDGSSTFIIHGSSNNSVTSGPLTPTGSVLSLTSSVSATILPPPVTVAFVPPVLGQCHSVTSSTSSTSNHPHQSVPIASCKGNIVEVDVVTVGQFQPGYEEEKPFTISDYYKYSEKYRKAKGAAAAAASSNSQKPSEGSKVLGGVTSTSGNNFTEPILTVPKVESTSELISRLEAMNLQSANGSSKNSFSGGHTRSASQFTGHNHPNVSQNAHQLGHSPSPYHHQHHHSLVHATPLGGTSVTENVVAAAAATLASDDNNNLPVF